MPIRHTDKGWYWGGKGPFDTKAQALAVARAAYAHGYKGENELTEGSIMVEEFLSGLLHSVTITHMFHLKSRSYSEHMALGAFYEGVSDLVDGLIEAYQGKYGLVNDYILDAGDMPASSIEYMISLSEFVKTARADFVQDSELQNMIDEIASLIDSTIYKLRFLG